MLSARPERLSRKTAMCARWTEILTWPCSVAACLTVHACTSPALSASDGTSTAGAFARHASSSGAAGASMLLMMVALQMFKCFDGSILCQHDHLTEHATILPCPLQQGSSCELSASSTSMKARPRTHIQQCPRTQHIPASSQWQFGST
jgi:hypothetical protein